MNVIIKTEVTLPVVAAVEVMMTSAVIMTMMTSAVVMLVRTSKKKQIIPNRYPAAGLGRALSVSEIRSGRMQDRRVEQQQAKVTSAAIVIAGGLVLTRKAAADKVPNHTHLHILSHALRNARAWDAGKSVSVLSLLFLTLCLF